VEAVPLLPVLMEHSLLPWPLDLWTAADRAGTVTRSLGRDREGDEAAMTVHLALPFPVRGRFAHSSFGDDGLTVRERRRRAKHYARTAASKSSAAEMDALAAEMKARMEVKSRHIEG
jgi:hypothetical protein